MSDLLKNELRRDFRERRRGLGAGERRLSSDLIVNRLIALPSFAESLAIAVFWPLEDEVDVRPLIRKALDTGKSVYLPRVDHDGALLEFCPFSGDAAELEPSTFGLSEPRTPAAPAAEIDLVVVPGLAFDIHHHRLGYGAGYYDRFLKTARAKSVGVAFDVQTIDILPVAEHDMALDMVVTESRVF